MDQWGVKVEVCGLFSTAAKPTARRRCQRSWRTRQRGALIRRLRRHLLPQGKKERPVHPRLGRDGGDVVGHRLGVDRAVVDASPCRWLVEPGQGVLHPVDVVAVGEVLAGVGAAAFRCGSARRSRSRSPGRPDCPAPASRSGRCSRPGRGRRSRCRPCSADLARAARRRSSASRRCGTPPRPPAWPSAWPAAAWRSGSSPRRGGSGRTGRGWPSVRAGCSSGWRAPGFRISAQRRPAGAAEHHQVDQAVGAQPVGAVHRDAGRLADRHQAGHHIVGIVAGLGTTSP